MIKRADCRSSSHDEFGISAISVFKPDWVLPNDWFDSSLSRKFVKHTGIRNRSISMEDEVALAVGATRNLVSETNCDLRDCAGIVFTSPSFVPMSAAHRLLNPLAAKREQLARAAVRFTHAAGIQPRHGFSTNSFCCGFARAISIVQSKLGKTMGLSRSEFILVITSSQISRITDYSCLKTGPLFGDLATATLIARSDSHKYPTHFDILAAKVEKQPTNRPFFDFRLQRDALRPTPSGGQRIDSQRVVFSLDGMAIADVAPRAMANAAATLSAETGIRPTEIQFIVPHQAGSGIVRFTEMKLREAGFSGEVINGLTSDVGNVSSGSIPHALKKLWNQLDGNILCPAAAVGKPGRQHVYQGCIILRSTRRHQAKAA